MQRARKTLRSYLGISRNIDQFHINATLTETQHQTNIGIILQSAKQYSIVSRFDSKSRQGKSYRTI